ncbi:sensor histidine kinase [Brevibacterium album]|uniref:sensor histidine kinase n=1 Tax=Brevibacterium album TaxID=417948 RepID=UPI000427516B|nr:ATP-binding protein [Brevibacterium album]
MGATRTLRRRMPGAPPQASGTSGLRRLFSWPSASAASRIVAANSIMLVGIVLLLCTALYLVLSGINDERVETRISESAQSLATGPTLTGNVVNPALARAEAGATDLPLPAFVPGSNENAAIAERLEFQREAYDFDVVAVVPLSYLERGRGLGGTSAGLAAGEEEPLIALAPDSVPGTASALSTALARLGPERLSGGGVSVRFFDEPMDMLVATVPVTSEEGELLGVTAVGVAPATVRAEFAPQLAAIAGFGVLTVVLGVLANWVTSRGLRRATGDYGTHEIGAVLEYYSSVLRAVSEGLVLVDRGRGIVFHNAEAAELLGLPARAGDEALALEGLDLDVSLEQLLTEGRYARDEIHYTTNHVLVVNQQPAASDSGTWVTTMRDHTELQGLIGELVSVRSFSESLRSQTHEYANRLHMIVSLMETGQFEEAVEFVTREISQVERPADNLLDGFDHPVLSALLLTKFAQAGESGIALELDTDDLHDRITADDRDLVTVVGNLIDNAFDAVGADAVPPEHRRVRVRFAGNALTGLVIEVSDDGPGIADEAVDRIFDRGWSTKHDGVSVSGEGRESAQSVRGVGLSIVVQAVRRMQGAIDVQGSGGELIEDAEAADLPLPLKGAMFTVWVPAADAGGGEGDEASHRGE